MMALSGSLAYPASHHLAKLRNAGADSAFAFPDQAPQHQTWLLNSVHPADFSIHVPKKYIYIKKIQGLKNDARTNRRCLVTAVL